MTNHVDHHQPECRTIYRHRWDDYAGSDWRPSFGSGVEMRCERCGTVQRLIIDANGDIASRQYIYPPGYRYGRGEKPSNNELRLTVIAKRMREARARRRNAS